MISASTRAKASRIGSSIHHDLPFERFVRRCSPGPAPPRLPPVLEPERLSAPGCPPAPPRPGRVSSIPLLRSVAAVLHPPWPDIRDVAVMCDCLARWRLAPLPDPGTLAAQGTQVVQLCPAYPAPGHHLDLVDRRAMHREGAL